MATWERAAKASSNSSACFACGIPFPQIPPKDQWGNTENHTKGMSMSSRYECTACRNHFCIDCDLFAHEVVHNCPGCQSKVHGGGNGSSNGSGQTDGMDTSA